MTSLVEDYATYTYTPNGQRASVKDANGNLSAYEFVLVRQRSSQPPGFD